MTRYHIESKTDSLEINGCMLKNAMRTGDGHYKGVMDYNGDDPIYMDDCVDDCADVITWDPETRQEATE